MTKVSTSRKPSTVIPMETISIGDANNGDGRKKSTLGSVLSAHNINYRVKVRTKLCGAQIEKQILTDVTAVFKQGMTAIMGPTGSGKSTFLDILASRKNPAGVSGHLLLDGRRVPLNFKCMVGYVVQDDTVMGTLSIRENIQFSAALRLPSSVSRGERIERVNNVIKELGLDKCADTKVGNEFIRGVSGGERKRCSIGMELILSPPVLFLDEPTTGLDADTAYTVLRFLKRLSSRGRTIIFSIHQPRYAIFCLFDQLLLLAGGCVLFNGPTCEALDFFSSQGFRCEVHNNPPDFFLDVINGHEKPNADGLETETQEEPSDEEHVSQASKLITGFRQSYWNRRLQEEAAAIISKFESRGLKDGQHQEVSYATSFLSQVLFVGKRSLKDTVRNPQTSILTIGASLLFAALIIAIFWQVKGDPISAFKDRCGVFFFLVVNQLFFNMAAVDVFIKERRIFIHEHISGFYRVSVYFLVKIIFDIVPMRSVPVLLISGIVYYAVGLRPGAENFFMLVFTLFCITIAGAALCFFICATLRVFAVAHMSLALIYIVMMLLGGFLISLDSIGPWLRWGQYFSFFKYSLAALYIKEFKGRTFCDANATYCESGDTFLKHQQIDFRETWDLWLNHVALLTMSAALLVLTYIQLRRMNKFL
ncbi:hypothetical protein BsWGS_08556 [Bradybaena similaris]